MGTSLDGVDSTQQTPRATLPIFPVIPAPRCPLTGEPQFASAMIRVIAAVPPQNPPDLAAPPPPLLLLRRRLHLCLLLQVIVIDGYLLLKVTPYLYHHDFFASLSLRSAQGLYRQLGKACPMPPLSSLNLEALTQILL